MLEKGKFKIGQVVRMNDGTKDDDFGMDMGGWHGRVLSVDSKNQMILIALDSIALYQMPIEHIEDCEEKGLGWPEYNIGYDEVTVATARDTEEDVDAAVSELEGKVGWSYLGEEGREMNAILAGATTTTEELAAWRKHLESTLTFPFKGEVDEWQDPRSSVRSGDRVRILKIVDVDEMYGILVKVKRKFSTFTLPLCDLKALDEKSPNHDPVQLYAVWYANR